MISMPSQVIPGGYPKHIVPNQNHLKATPEPAPSAPFTPANPSPGVSISNPTSSSFSALIQQCQEASGSASAPKN